MNTLHALYPPPAVPEQAYWQIREVSALLYKRDGVIEVDYTLWETTHAFTFTIVISGSIVGEHIISMLRKIVCTVHV